MKADATFTKVYFICWACRTQLNVDLEQATVIGSSVVTRIRCEDCNEPLELRIAEATS